MASPPPLIFDDGSRIILNQPADNEYNKETFQSTNATTDNKNVATTISSRRGSTSIAVYYEIDRLSSAIVGLLFSSAEPPTEHSEASPTNNSTNTLTNRSSNSSCRVALQFPDELLVDAPFVVWELEQALMSKLPPFVLALVFILGDTTFGPCCPDEIAAQHLQANVLIHYGHACLSSSSGGAGGDSVRSSNSSSLSSQVPVLYSFGKAPHAFNVHHCVDAVQELSAQPLRRVVLLYQVQYHYAMEDLQTQLSERGDVLVVMGQVPEPTLRQYDNKVQSNPIQDGCGSGSCGCVSGSTSIPTIDHADVAKDTANANGDNLDDHTNTTTEPSSSSSSSSVMILGGLELPGQLDWSSYTLLYIGDVLDDDDDDEHQQHRPQQQQQWINILLRFLSSSESNSSPANTWVYSPRRQLLDTSPLSNSKLSYSRLLQRRFYLIQRARDASVFGIVVGTLSNRYFATVVQELRTTLEQAGRSVYILAVGKINANKLANFADVECFVLVACPEQHGDLLLPSAQQQQQRGGGGGPSTEYHAPIITPLELQMAMGNVEWGTTPYSLDDRDYLATTTRASGRNDALAPNQHDAEHDKDHDGDTNDDDDDDDDAPYFSLVTGTYQSRKHPVVATSSSLAPTISSTDDSTMSAATNALSTVPNTANQQQLVAFSSSAASFLQQRDYRGLEPQWGETPVQAATVGLSGIASNYGEQAEQPAPLEE